MANKKDSLYVSNTTQGTIILNCSFSDKDGNVVDVFHHVPPARQCFGVLVPREDWDRVKKTHIVSAWVAGGFLLPEKKKVTIDQETEKTTSPKPTGELEEASLTNLVKGNVATVHSLSGKKSSKTSLQGK
jgi:hypothetical protein